MKIAFDKKSAKTDALVVFAAQDGKSLRLLAGAREADGKAKGALSRSLDAAGFAGRKAEVQTVSGLAGLAEKSVVVVGLGKMADVSAADFEKCGTAVVARLNALRAASANTVFPAASDITAKGVTVEAAATRFVTGALLSTYRFDAYLTKEPADKKPTLKAFGVSVPAAVSATLKKIFAQVETLADGVFFTRDLVSEPPNVLYPESFARRLQAELKSPKVKVTVLGKKELQKNKMGALLAVGQGSAREPKLVTMEYRGGGRNAKTLAIVGKGITFDTGGISLKPGPGMEDMKWDMAGAGAVAGLMKLLAARGAKVNVVGVVALAENMPGGNAYRPGDIVTSMSGQTIEVHNTDAEGRLVLADALWYAQEKFKPTHVIDLATLTGAIIIALGHEYGGLFANDDALAEKLAAAGAAVGEPLWRMPMHEAWDKAIDTPQADMKNISGGRDAGSAIGAHFLKRFIKDGVSWAHLDIAAMAWSAKDRTAAPKGATGFGVRLLDAYIADNWEK